MAKTIFNEVFMQYAKEIPRINNNFKHKFHKKLSQINSLRWVGGSDLASILGELT